MKTTFTNGTLNFAAGSQVGGSPILTENDSIPWSSLSNIPSGLDDGDNDTLGGLSCSNAETISFNGTEWVCVSSTVSFNELADIPEDLLDGDSDSLGVLSCDDGQIAVYSTEANGWICGDMSSSTNAYDGTRIGTSNGGNSYESGDTPETFNDNYAFGFVSTKYINDEFSNCWSQPFLLI